MLFKNIIGQEQTKKRLIRSVKENRVSHAQLFLGPEGCGKLALAIAYAQYINCENKKDNDSCGICKSCLKYEKIIHPDLHFLYPISPIKDRIISSHFLPEWRKILLENNCYVSLSEWYESIGIENKQGFINAKDCNETIKTLSYKSYESEYKVMIIWMIENLFHSAAPKLLKILEEPPDKTLFILICENHEQVINTILSRAQIIKIPKISDKELSHALTQIHEITPKRANEIIRLTEGNYIDARSLSGDVIENELFTEIHQWLRLCYANNFIEIIGLGEKFAKKGREKQKGFFLETIRILRESFLAGVKQFDIIKAEGEELIFAKKFSQFFHKKNYNQIFQELNDAISHIERNANPKILWLDLSIKIAEFIKIKA